MAVHQISLPESDEQVLKAAMKTRKDLKDVPTKDAIKVLAMERAKELAGVKA